MHGMDPRQIDRQRRAREVFDRALDAGDPDARGRVLEDEPDPQTRALAETWLAEYEHLQPIAPIVRLHMPEEGVASIGVPGSPITSLTNELGDGAPRPTLLDAGSLIGGCRVTRLLGSGAHAEVYEGEQVAPNRPVAIKVLRAVLMGEDFARRLRLEAEVVSMLDHPGIVPVYGAGVEQNHPSARGLPYIIMAMVPGKTLGAWRADTRPGWSASVRVVASVADAVHHANLRGVVHRDLKPANIVVDSAGVPRVLDFGVALLQRTAHAAARETFHTTGQLVGTPQYMAPEQLSPGAGRVDLRADVYSLGAVLFELVTGKIPIEIDESMTFAEISRAKEAGTPDLFRRLESCGCPRQLRHVIAAALEPQPDRRCESCGELRDELRRVLEGRPIRSRSPGWPERLILAACRQPVIATLVMLFVLSLLAGITGVAWQARVAAKAARVATAQRDLAEQRFADTRELARLIMWDQADALSALPGTTEIRRAMVVDADHYLTRLERSMLDSEDPAARAGLLMDLAEGRTRLGDILGNSAFMHLGDYAGAAAQYRAALAALDTLDTLNASPGATSLNQSPVHPTLAPPTQWARLAARARALFGLGVASQPADISVWLPLLESACTTMAQADAIAPNDPHTLSDLAFFEAYTLAGQAKTTDDPVTLRRQIDSAVARAEMAAALPGADARSTFVLARAIMYRADVNYLLGPIEAVAADLERSLAIWNSLPPGAAGTVGVLPDRERAIVMGMLARADAVMGRRDRVEALSLAAIDLATRLAAADPNNPQILRVVEGCLSYRATALLLNPHIRDGQPGGPLEPADLADAQEARRCLEEAAQWHTRRRDRGLVGPGEHGYLDHFNAQIRTIDQMIEAAGGGATERNPSP